MTGSQSGQSDVEGIVGRVTRSDCDGCVDDPAAYMRHRRRGDDPCAAAKKAWRERQREYRMRKEIDRGPAT